MALDKQVFLQFINKHQDSYKKSGAQVGERPFENTLAGNFKDFHNTINNDVDDPRLKKEIFAELDKASKEIGKMVKYLKKNDKYDHLYVANKYKEISKQLYTQLEKHYNANTVNKIAINFLTNAQARYMRKNKFDLANKKNNEVKDLLILMQSVFYQATINTAIVKFVEEKLSRGLTPETVEKFFNISGKENFLKAVVNIKDKNPELFKRYVNDLKSSKKELKEVFEEVNKVKFQQYDLKDAINSAKTYFSKLNDAFSKEPQGKDLFSILNLASKRETQTAISGRLFFQNDYNTNSQKGFIDGRKDNFLSNDIVNKLLFMIKVDNKDIHEFTKSVAKSIEDSSEWKSFCNEHLQEKAFVSLKDDDKKKVYQFILAALVYRVVSDCAKVVEKNMPNFNAKNKELLDKFPLDANSPTPLNLEFFKQISEQKKVTSAAPIPLKDSSSTILAEMGKQKIASIPAQLRNTAGIRVKPRINEKITPQPESDEMPKNISLRNPDIQKLKTDTDALTKWLDKCILNYSNRIADLPNADMLKKELNRFVASFKKELKGFSDIKTPTVDQYVNFLKILKAKNLVINTKMKQVSHLENDILTRVLTLYDDLDTIHKNVLGKLQEMQTIARTDPVLSEKILGWKDKVETNEMNLITELVQMKAPEQLTMLEKAISNRNNLLTALEKAADVHVKPPGRHGGPSNN